MKFIGFLVSKKIALIFVVLGSAAGFLYWRFVGCASGSCAITSNPVMSTLYGALLGWFTGDLFSSEKTKTKNDKQ